MYNDFGVMICFCGMFVEINDLGSTVGMCVGTMFFVETIYLITFVSEVL